MDSGVKFIIDATDQGKRLDKFLSEKMPSCSRSEIQKMIKEKNILINAAETKSSYKIKPGDIIDVTPPENKIDLSPDPSIKFIIIHDEKDFAVIDKPAGLVVYPGTKHNEKTLINGLLAIWPEIKNVGEDPLRPGIVHRLDKDTSGLMIIAKNYTAFEFFTDLFKNKKIEKTYTALAFGHIAESEGKINFPIRRSKNNPVKQVAVKKKDHEEAREAVTYFKTLNFLQNIKGDQYTLIEAKPKTGRMHQIRVHLAAIGHPIVGDKLYQIKNIIQPAEISRHFLHASKLEFTSPSAKNLRFYSPLPENLLRFLKTLTDAQS